MARVYCVVHTMDREIFEIETGLVADDNKETFQQWQMKKSMEHLQDALNDMYTLMDKFMDYVRKQNGSNVLGERRN
jgi:hypothetical protein